MLSAQASGAQVEALWLTVYSNSNRMNIRQPAAIGVALGVAHIMTELSGFPA